MSSIAVSSRQEEEVRPRGPRDLSIDYLRTTLTLMVIAHHSSLAYTSWAFFDRDHIFRSTAPVVDQTRWVFFDYAENFNDVFFMSLMFFISGLFVYPALRKHGTLRFLRDRLLRLGVPFVLAVTLLMPIAYYASWQMSGRSIGFLDFYRQLAERGFAVGPPWFIWVLLLFDVVLAFVMVPLGCYMPLVEQAMERLREHPFAAFAGAAGLSGLVYLPLLARYGFGAWTVLVTSPFAFQIARIGLYALWFVLGFLVGAPGLRGGLLARDAGLAKRWPVWLALCIVAYNTLWFFPRIPLVHRLLGHSTGDFEALLWVFSCTASSFGFLALFRGVSFQAHAWTASLNRSAYGMYLVHYVYVTWLQRLFLGRPIHAGLKFLFVFAGATFLSWLSVQAFLRIPGLRNLL